MDIDIAKAASAMWRDLDLPRHRVLGCVGKNFKW